MKHLDKVGTVVKAAIFCAIAFPFTASVLSACVLALNGAFKLHMAYEFPALITLVFLFAFIPACACGALGSIYLILRTKRIGLGLRMFAETGVLGVALSMFCSLLMSWLLGPGSSTLFFISFWTSAGVLVSILYAAYFRRSMLSITSSNASSDTKEANTTQS